MKREIPAEADDVALACIGYDETLIAQTAMQGGNVHGSLP